MDHHLVTYVIIAANILISIKGFNDFAFLNRYKFHMGSVQRGEYDRLITSGFLHADYTHLAFNMITFYFFAGQVIAQFGQTRFLLIYFVALLAGNLFELWLHNKEYHYSSLGASGAVMGIVYSSILLAPEREIYVYFFPIKSYLFGIGYLLYSIYGMRAKADNISHTAHFGGAVGGYALTLIFLPELFITDRLLVILLAAPIIILFILNKTGKL